MNDDFDWTGAYNKPRVLTHKDWREYKCISAFYEGKSAKRSKVPYMQHIDEGLIIMKDLGASEEAMRAYCVHPIFQEDHDLKSMWDDPSSVFEACSLNPSKQKLHWTTVVLAMEYRSVANAHLSYHSPNLPKLSPIKEVNDMLRADKIQNCKDFELHNSGVENAKRLSQYFHDEWFVALDISEEQYGMFLKKLAKGVDNFNACD